MNSKTLQASTAPSAQPAPFTDAELARLDSLLQSVPAPLQALDLSALDGYLCGVLLQPQRPPPSRWWPFVTDVEGRPLPAGSEADELRALVQRRHAELDQALSQRQWFDPWIYGSATEEEAEPADDDTEPGDPVQAVLPWVAGFAAAMEHFPTLMELTDPALVEPLALLFMHFDADDLEDADGLLAVIETLEPASDLAEAVQDLVRALMLIADVTRPLTKAPLARASQRQSRSSPQRQPRHTTRKR